MLAALAVLLVLVPAATADCGDDILDDWQDNNVVDRNYPSLCYPLAFAQIPEDAEQYSSIVADVQRAEQRDRRLEQQGEAPDVPPPTREELEDEGIDPATPPPPPTATVEPPDAATSSPETTDVAPVPADTVDRGGTGVEDDGTGIFGELIGAGGTDTADEVPTAVKVLGGAAGLLLLVGAAGLVAQRRSQGRG